MVTRHEFMRELKYSREIQQGRYRNDAELT